MVPPMDKSEKPYLFKASIPVPFMTWVFSY